jgi:hypothetical protein
MSRRQDMHRRYRETMLLHRGLRPHHVRKDGIGTQEAPSGPIGGHCRGIKARDDRSLGLS